MSVQIEFISSSSLAGKSSAEKIKFILGIVKQEKKILVLEEPLSSTEEKQLISSTMANVDKKFPGIEVCSLGDSHDAGTQNLITWLIKLLGGKTSGLTVIGPSNLVKQVKRDPGKLRLWTSS
ncbi:DUF2073 domain-containing protein [Candidatus Micrarchaeota archaeon]|nr:DUF2073 domain-containing protein [Candidatus Micrarchaeota archaeon]